ncbi:MAG: hypothetical protein IT375_35545 [Polyangiaceae bacterium]|nr:hypothetical protein [Polyangiaceae bacterium]
MKIIERLTGRADRARFVPASAAHTDRGERDGWNSWITFDPPVGPPIYAPATGCAGSAPPGLVSVTPSRWQDDPVSTVVPVIFATDKQGNVHHTTYETGPCTQSACDCETYCQPWKSFCHAKRWVDYEP